MIFIIRKRMWVDKYILDSRYLKYYSAQKLLYFLDVKIIAIHNLLHFKTLKTVRYQLEYLITNKFK